MTNLPAANLAVTCMTIACFMQGATAQSVTLVEGASPGPMTVKVVDPWTGSSQVVLQGATLTAIDKTARTINDEFELRSTRRITRHGLQRLERADGNRLFAYANISADQYGLLLVPSTGAARIVYSSSDAIEAPIAINASGTFAAFGHDFELTIISLKAGNFASTSQPWRTVTMPSEVESESVMVGRTHAFFVCDNHCVYRTGLADGSTFQNITPNSPGYEQGEEMAMSGDGTSVAFLRGATEYAIEVWFAGSSGPSRRLQMPPRQYREVSYLPEEDGIQRLLLNEDGSRLLITEVRVEDEVFYLDTNNIDAAMHITDDVKFSTYIGVHILPGFIADTLVMASGHTGWMDWYATRPDGTVINLTETGSSESPFLVGSLDVQNRFPLANNTLLATEALGTMTRLRHIDPAGSTTLMFSDLVAPPSVGSSLSGQSDLRVATLTGQHIILGTNGAVRLSVPSSITLSDPLRSAQGLVACYASVGGGFGVPILMLPDGTNVFGTMGTTVPQMSFSDTGELHILWPTQLEVMSPAGGNVIPLPASANRTLVSGAGA